MSSGGDDHGYIARYAAQGPIARFPFGRKQFDSFMTRIGCTTLVRGHEKVDEGFRDVYPDHPFTLLNLFSAGGIDNEDLPSESSYRSVTPMACTILVGDGDPVVTPWEIDYHRFQNPKLNRFFASKPEIDIARRTALVESAVHSNGPGRRGMPARPSEPPVTEVHLKAIA